MEDFKRRLIEVERGEGIRLVHVRRAVNSCLSGGGKKKVALLCVSIYNERTRKLRPYLNIARKTHVAMCKNFGYTYVERRVGKHSKERDPPWEKISMIRSQLKQRYDYVAVIDSDAIILNPKRDVLGECIRIMGKRDVFVCNEEWNGTGRRLDIVGVTSQKRKRLNTAVNTGWIVCKNTTWTKKFFDRVWNVEPRRLRKWPWEQRSFVKVLRSLDPDELRKHVHVEAAKIYNSLKYPPVKKQAILHMMGKNINRSRNKRAVSLWNTRLRKLC